MRLSNKNKYLIGGLLVTLFICYEFGIAKTLELRSQYKKLQREEALYESSPKQFSILKQKERYYDSIKTKYHLEGLSVQNNLLKSINNFTKELDLELVSFSEPHSVITDEITINTNTVIVEGSYNATLSLLYNLEQHSRFGEIISVQILKQKDFRKNKDYLQTTFLLKSYQ